MPTKSKRIKAGRIPRDLAAHPVLLPTSEPWPAPRTYPVQLRGDKVTITIADVGGEALITAPPSALMTLVGLTTCEVYAAHGWGGPLAHDGDMSIVRAREFNRLLGRECRSTGYLRTQADLNALFRLAISVDGYGPMGNRVTDNYRILAAVGSTLPSAAVGGYAAGFEFRWQISRWLARQIKQEATSTVPLSAMASLRSPLALVLLPWILTRSPLESVKKSGGYRERLESLWWKFPTSTTKPFASEYRRRLERALIEIVHAGLLQGFHWEKRRDGWDSHLALRIGGAPLDK